MNILQLYWERLKQEYYDIIYPVSDETRRELIKQMEDYEDASAFYWIKILALDDIQLRSYLPEHYYISYETCPFIESLDAEDEYKEWQKQNWWKSRRNL